MMLLHYSRFWRYIRRMRCGEGISGEVERNSADSEEHVEIKYLPSRLNFFEDT